jgi:hypothetical protein
VVESAIVAGNTGGAGDLYVPANSKAVQVAHSAIGVTTSITLTPDSGNNLPFGTDPKLGPLADNGGPTQTVALLPGSPAIDAGANPTGLVFDQRGFNFARVAGAAADIGAFEVQRPATVQSVVVNGGAVQRSRVIDVTITFSHLVTLPTNSALAFRLTRTGPGGPAGDGTLTADLSASTATQTIARLTFSGALIEFGSLIDGTYTLTVIGSQVTGPGGLALDGDGDGTPGGDNVTTLYRLFGDADGNRTVNVADLTLFRSAYGTVTTDPTFDFNGDGVISATDLAAFRVNFGSGL